MMRTTMWSMILSLVVVFPSSGGSVWAQEFNPQYTRKVRPNVPPIPDQYKPTLEKLIPPAKHFFQIYGVKRGETVVLVNSRWWDPLWPRAWREAGRQLGIIVDTIWVAPVSRTGSPIMFDMGTARERWWPKYLLGVLDEADWVSVSHDIGVTLGGIWSAAGGGGQGQKKAKRFLGPHIPYSSEQMAYTPWTMYPVELDLAIQRKVWEFLDYYGDKPKKIRITDPLGTDFTFTLLIDKEWVKENFGEEPRGDHIPRVSYLTSHHSVYMRHSKNYDPQGVLVLNSTHYGPQPTMKLHLNKGRIRVEGGGSFGEFMRGQMAKYADVKYPVQLGVDGSPVTVGAHYLLSVAIGTHPKAVRGEFFSPTYYQDQGSYWTWNQGMRRAGVLHFSCGDPLQGRYASKKIPEGVAPFKPNCGHLYFATMTVDGKPLIKNGHLTVLDDPEIRKLASKFGDPDELLKEAWNPSLEEAKRGWPNSQVEDRWPNSASHYGLE